MRFPSRLPEPRIRVLESIELWRRKWDEYFCSGFLGVPIPVILLLWLFFGR
jgi:hypothetical protein